MRHRIERLGEAAWEVLQRMVRELVARKPGGHLLESDLRQLELRLPLALKGEDADPKRFAESLAQSIDQLLDDAVEHAAAFRPGHAYCHRCRTAACDHSQPPTCRHVFVGYAPTGTPCWKDFAQLCLDLKHPEVDRLYEEPPAFLTLVQGREELHGGMLDAFHNESYELLGQLTAGFFRVRTRQEEGRGVLALTIQAAASRSKAGRTRLGLNLLGRAPGGEELDRLWERHDELPWRKAVRWAQAALQSLNSTNKAQTDLERRVLGILRGLARRLARDRRARTRRTHHAEERHASGQRPTRKAVEDAHSAKDDALMIDERSGTMVVLGERGRTHFFTLEGLLVSSVRYSRDAIARKVKQQRWRQASVEEMKSLRDNLPE